VQSKLLKCNLHKPLFCPVRMLFSDMRCSYTYYQTLYVVIYRCVKLFDLRVSVHLFHLGGQGFVCCCAAWVQGHVLLCIFETLCPTCDRHGQWCVWKRLNRDYGWRGRSKPGCQMAGLVTIVWLTTEADMVQLCRQVLCLTALDINIVAYPSCS